MQVSEVSKGLSMIINTFYCLIYDKMAKRSRFSWYEYCLRIAPHTVMIHEIHHLRTPPRHLLVDIALDGDLRPLVFCRCQS